jgi:hypothetical protein
MSIKKKILVVALAMGTLVGFGSGIAHVKMMHGHCQRSRVEAWGEQAGPDCKRGAQGWRHGGHHWDSTPPPQSP